ncbi:PadR family transcriptional regulator [bacterium]
MQKNKLIVLGLLYEKPMHGYQILQEIKKRHMNIWAKIVTASIYNNLAELCSKKLIKNTANSSHQDRNVFAITQDGKKYLKKLICENIEEMKPNMNSKIAYLLSVSFIHVLNPTDASKSLTIRKNHMEKMLAEIESKLNDTKNIPFNIIYVINSFRQHLAIEFNGISNLIKDITKKERKK